MLPTALNPQSTLAAPSSLQSALQMDANQHMQLQQQQQQQQQPTPGGTKKRKKNETSAEEGTSTTEPRRLRRSHEACARCRSKKIKCDSKHPRCTACATAGTPCHQEDRHRQTLTPRGYTERIEHQLAQCEALLKRHYPSFDLDALDDVLAREGIDMGALSLPLQTPAFQFQQPSAPRPFRSDPPPPQNGQPPKGYPAQMYPPHPQHMIPPPGYPHPMMYGPAPPYPMQMPGPPGYNPHIHPAFQPPPGQYPPPHPQQQQQQQQLQQQQQQQHLPPQPHPQRSAPSVTKGQDPNGNDMSNTESLAKNFGVSAAIVSDLKLGPGSLDKEDIGVDAIGLSSGRDRDIYESATPRDTTHWVAISVRRNSNASNPGTLSLSGSRSHGPSIDVWLPKDRKMVQHIVEVYFTRLNVHRPVYPRFEFEKVLNDLYDGLTLSHDPGFICSLYLILALGTLSELNHRAVKNDIDGKGDTAMEHLGSAVAKKLMPHDWPEHDEFFERALSVKPDLRVTISSLQALILLHWYLYTERQGRTLWRLAGSLVRLAVELGLHHDPTSQINPTTQQGLFSEDECQLRIRLWGIILIHDRGTSILLGRPLAIAPADSNTPRPVRSTRSPHISSTASLTEFSEHFELSHPVAEIQADIINSLYTPKRQSGDAIMRSATRIIRNLLAFRKSMPERYQPYFNGTTDWPLDKKSKLVQDITEDEGLTLLKIGISRILLLRALFSSKELSYAHRHKALIDAIVTSHNTIIVHNQLIRFPDIAFFTSPIPLHIAAMVILYGHMSKCDNLPRHTALEDVWLALDMLPRFRWRWQRKDFNGGHPLIAKLAERVMDVNLHQVGPASHPVLLAEPDWEEENDVVMSPVAKEQLSTPTMPTVAYPGGSSGSGGGYGSHGRTLAAGTPGSVTATGSSGTGSGGSTPRDKHLVEMPTGLFYPFYPEAQVVAMPPPHGGGGERQGQVQDYNHLLAAAAAAQDGSYGYQPSQDSYMSEERDPGMHHQQGMHMWMNVQAGQRGTASYPLAPLP